MIQRPDFQPKADRLAAFFEAYPLRVRVTGQPLDPSPSTSALHLFADDAGGIEALTLAVRGALADTRAILTAEVSFGGSGNPLLSSMPDALTVPVNESNPALYGLICAFRSEAQTARCGHRHALDRLGEVLILMVLRAAIEAGSSRPCLLAGLAHPQLHRVLVAMHDTPHDRWTVEGLAQLACMSRSRFMATFSEVVGTTPMAYLTRWRLQFGQRELQKGKAQVKVVARRAGFGSAEAFSRAYAREFGRAPIEDARRG